MRRDLFSSRGSGSLEFTMLEDCGVLFAEYLQDNNNRFADSMEIQESVQESGTEETAQL